MPHPLLDIHINAGGLKASAIGKVADAVILLSLCNTQRGAANAEHAPEKEVEVKVAPKVVYRTERKQNAHSNRGEGAKQLYLGCRDLSAVGNTVEKTGKNHHNEYCESKDSRLTADFKQEVSAIGVNRLGIQCYLALKALASDADTDPKIFDKHPEGCIPLIGKRRQIKT